MMYSLKDLCTQFFGLVTPAEQRQDVSENDLLCFKNAVRQFLGSGRKEDAFSVYFCFCEIFKLFGQGYDNTKKLLEMLSDHEYHSGELLSKHRDHYSHSVYVFALGLAIYKHDGFFRKTYLNFYGLKDGGYSALQFMKFWGLVALFHDIGYPFQLAHEQIKTYSEEVCGKDTKVNPYVSFGNMQEFIRLDDGVKEILDNAFPGRDAFENLNELFAYGLKKRDGYDEKKVCEILLKRVERQPHFMDHGYFSAVILARRLFKTPDFKFGMRELDVFTAILLHNNFNKFDAPDRHLIDIAEHPLAYLLMLCDELQSWDRLAYGKVSKRDPIAWDISLKITDSNILIKYIYDSYTVRTEDKDGQLEVALNKNYREMREGVFTEKIFGSAVVRGEEYVKRISEENSHTADEKKRTKLYDGYIVSPLKLSVQTEERIKEKRYKLYTSDDSFINICDLAKAIHSRYNEHCKGFSGARIDADFGKLPLEFKLSNIEQAKSYAEKLELINCFYSSKELDYPVVNDFNNARFSEFKDNIGFLSREEHVRWVKEKLAMGWKYGTDYDENNVEERNAKKIHKSIVPYDLLDENERSKDMLMVNNIIELLKKFDSNIRIYNYRSGRKPNLEIAGTGHRFFTDNPEVLKKDIKAILREYSKDYRVIVRSCFGFGADQLIAECAVEMGITLKADLPMDYEDFINDVKTDTVLNGHPFTEEDEMKMRHLLAQAVVCKTIPDPVHTYAEASRYIVQKCNKLIVLWDGIQTPLYDSNHNPINRGGTYDTLCMAKDFKLGKNDIHIISCHR